MNKDLNNLLEKEIKRFNSILSYQDTMNINEVSYRFYNELNEQEPDETESEEPIEEPVDQEMGGEEFSDETQPDDEAGMEPETDGTETEPQDFSDSGFEGDEIQDEEVTEIDVTDLVNTTNDIKTKLDGVTSGLGRINDIMSKVSDVETKLTKMDDLINQMQVLAKQVELMRPPTEEERRKALAKDSYPFNVSLDDYKSGSAIKNQTELENNSKMSMMDTIMKDYNEMDVRRSFNIPNENAFLKA